MPTFQFERTAGPKGKFKLDWIFVKSYLKDPRNQEGSRIMAPHFARTMFEADYALPESLSDHAPISVDLQFNEPSRSASGGSVAKTG